MVLLVVVEVLETSSSHYRWEALPISYTTVYHNPERKKRIELLLGFYPFSFAGCSLSIQDTFSFTLSPFVCQELCY